MTIREWKCTCNLPRCICDLMANAIYSQTSKRRVIGRSEPQAPGAAIETCQADFDAFIRERWERTNAAWDAFAVTPARAADAGVHFQDGEQVSRAIAALHAQHTPDGRPLRYLPGDGSQG